MRVLVTGGAGYVGSISAERLIELGHDVVVLDTLATGYGDAIPPQATLVEASTQDGAAVERALREHAIEAVLHCAARALVGESVADPALYYRDNVVGGVNLLDAMRAAGVDRIVFSSTAAVERALREHAIEAVLHCAARALVGESVADPALYYRDNVVGGVNLLDAMRAAGVDRIVFSSTAAVYGAPERTPITEDMPLRPINPYGETKRALEAAMAAYGGAYGLRSVALRYFNVAGASEERGERHSPETHLIPNLLAAVENGRRMTIFGDDYPTPDGTCIRDYIHVVDLADAHIAALELTASAEPGHLALNLGTGHGFSNREVIAAAERATGRNVPFEIGPRRPGDPPVLVAANGEAQRVLGWTPRRSTLEEMIGSAWAWRQARSAGSA